MVRYGMPSLFEAASVQSSGALCSRLGLSFVELNANFPPFQPDRLDSTVLRKTAEENGIFFTVHLDDGLNIADFNPLVAEAYCQTVKNTVQLAKDAGILVLNMHLPRGAVYTLPERKVYFAQQYEQDYLDAVARFRDRCDRWAEGAPLTICVENADGFLEVQRKAVDILLESSVFGLTLDIGHDHCAGGVDRAFVMERKARLRHMHMHDACLPNADHLPLGQGQLDIASFVELAQQQDTTVVLEVKTEAGLRQSIKYLK